MSEANGGYQHQRILVPQQAEVCRWPHDSYEGHWQANFKRKHMNTNPRQGPFHFRSPAKILWRSPALRTYIRLLSSTDMLVSRAPLRAIS